ncbi:MAG: nucleotidyltransferase domain-containing protein, partial [Candidatus Aenigmarchaeota archaeon]|nr:nucleotidyltransferase domain-containing protein [Candidatus Aenigmarchaeota archaeon]
VLFGSYARGEQKKTSDLDLLVVVKDLPENFWKRDEISKKLSSRFFEKYGVYLEVLLAKDSEIKKHAEWPNPIFFGILLGYRILYGEEFFEEVIYIAKERIKEIKPVYVDKWGRKWEMKKLI